MNKHQEIILLSSTLERLKRQYNKTLDKQLVRHIKYHVRQLRSLMQSPGY